jgi:TatD DNase family protein
MRSPVYFDSHCHFDFSEFDEGRSELWRSCRESGIDHLLIPGTAADKWSKLYGLVQQYEGIIMAVGIHPWWVDELSTDQIPDAIVKKLYHYADKKGCVAIGECGLDKMINSCYIKQEHIFEQQIKMAVDLDLPLIIHVRKTHNETLSLLKKYSLKAGGVVHGFTGSIDLAKRYWDLGFCLGIGGSITYPRANKTREAVKELPIEALLLETDSPDMPLNGFQGQINTPLKVIDVARILAKLRSDTIENIATQTTKNSCRLFKL